MMKRTTFLVGALLLLILANVLMMSVASPAFMVTGEGFKAHMGKKTASIAGFEDEEGEGFRSKKSKAKAKAKAEGYSDYSTHAAGAKDAYESIGAFDNIRLETGTDSSWRARRPNEPLRGPAFKPGSDELFMFKNNQCKPECCGSSYSCDGGCVCTTPDQREFINTRGGNRTRPESGV